ESMSAERRPGGCEGASSAELSAPSGVRPLRSASAPHHLFGPFHESPCRWRIQESQVMVGEEGIECHLLDELDPRWGRWGLFIRRGQFYLGQHESGQLAVEDIDLPAAQPVPGFLDRAVSSQLEQLCTGTGGHGEFY